MKIDFKNYSLVIFDLDDTLYSEQEYLLKAYLEISKFVGNEFKHVKQNEAYSFLKETFYIEGREQLFDKFCTHHLLETVNKDKLIGSFLAIMRTVSFDKKLNLNSKSYKLLQEAIRKTKVCIVTNGNPRQQKNKIRQINWKGLNKQLVFYYANEIEPKPSKRVFEKISLDYRITLEDRVLMIGDSNVDRDFANNIQAEFINICCLAK